MNWKKHIAIIIALINLNVQAAAGENLNIAFGEWPPYLSESFENKGVVALLIKDIFAEEGITVNLTFFPWARAYAETAKGEQDLTGVWMHKPERELDFYYSEPILTEKFVFFHLKTYPFDWTNLKDLKKLGIGGGIGYSYGPEFDAALDTGVFEIERVATDKQNFIKLLLGRIQVYPQEMNVGYAALKQHFTEEDVLKITHHPKEILSNQSYVLFPKKLHKSKALLLKFNRQLNKFKQNGRYEKYFDLKN
jgi:polar amino acid transport system substrate-binding protein